MFLKLKPLFYSIIFLFGLEMIAYRHDLAFAIMGALFFMSLFQGKRIGKEWIFSVLPIFFTISSAALLYLITQSLQEQTFILLASFMYYLSLFGAYRLSLCKKDQTARGMIMAASSATIFFTYSSAYGFYLNFFVPIYYLMFIYLVVTLLVSYQYFSIIKEEKKAIWIYSLILALIMAELIWTMNFWPFGYLTTGVVALILYYVLWEITQSHFSNVLSRKRVAANIAIFSLMIVMVLLSSKWIPVF